VSTYLQLVHQVHQALQLGLLEPGDQLPTAQQVVAKLGPSSSGHSPAPTTSPWRGSSRR
jgi:DNA-binding transcriptional MocR family regulator